MSDRRHLVPFDPRYFEKEKAARTLEDTFRHVFRTKHWSAREPVSGAGANREQTRTLESELPALLRDIGADAVLDLPCGDFGWMRFVDLPVSTYVGGDIVPELVSRNQELYGNAARRFEVLDITSDALPRADVILCRDCLVHLSFADGMGALRNICRSGIPYLLTTTFPNCPENEDITTGDWRLLNLEAPPFNLPAPIRIINEQCTEAGGAYRDKSLGLWRTSDLGASWPFRVDSNHWSPAGPKG